MVLAPSPIFPDPFGALQFVKVAFGKLSSPGPGEKVIPSIDSIEVLRVMTEKSGDDGEAMSLKTDCAVLR